MKREALTRYLDDQLDSTRFRDYCPNGLQVEGRAEVRHIVAGVTASLALVNAAIARGADTLLVHHGWFWRGEEGRVTGFRKARLQALLKHDINLIAYHLPLDGHVEFGNNAQLARRLGWSVEGRFGEQDIGWFGRLPQPTTLAELATSVAAGLGRAPQVIAAEAGAEQSLDRIAWCSGGAQNLFELAIAQGVEVYLSGEISEQNVHLARESGVPYIAAGHHATERFGVQALAAHLTERFGLTCEFVDIDNPV
ncbi:Nif3-like dinuclear metal center hexameric protein [Propionivibrio sp.]|uniref:Nif3-like dinuclear metal center hexameric protein n=1 Tax=Propionivibrio sp. TaxID=2212460 RepID=UPI0025DEE93B|nr:Nif3-like dinuclear metal center hexameric protein [Propionivibrio sp.]MBK7355232.1 Nif3-like dinuclear metal center hexameric protein [Propionivibrio sp.]MBK8399627.1 Nif3-like dinuclear metal center hexameric protein [Propionivibrio sp.]MBK8744920.1 Nif3-like dinuclear metal center hexameric protein [Propionivibrio sp.]